MYMMLKELETPFKINKFIYALDLFILIGFAGLGVLLQGMVFQSCKWFSLYSTFWWAAF